MELLDALQMVAQKGMKAAQLCDLVIGTVVADSPLEITIDGMMAPLKAPILYLTESVVEKKIPILEHSHTLGNLGHSHSVSGLSHIHDYNSESGTGQTESALGGSFGTSTALNDGSANTGSALDNIICYEHGKALPVENGYIILNRALAVGDKVLMLRVQNGQKFVILSRVFEVI